MSFTDRFGQQNRKCQQGHETLAKLKIDHVLTSVLHPQSNAKVERFHRTVHDALAKKVAVDQQNGIYFLTKLWRQ